MDDFEAYEAYEYYENFQQVYGRNIRRNFFEDMTDSQFIEFFRYDKEGVHNLVGLLCDYLGEEEDSDDDIEEEDEHVRNTSLEFQVNFIHYFKMRPYSFFL